MTERRGLPDSQEPPEDVATLYSWANLHGAKYRDFSASRAQTREKARQRVQEAVDAERHRSQDEAEAERRAEQQRTLDKQRHEMESRYRAEREAAERSAQWRPEPQQPPWSPPQPPPFSAPNPYPQGNAPFAPQAPAYPPAGGAYPPAQSYGASQGAPFAPPQYGPAQPYSPAPREDLSPPNRPWMPDDQRENAVRPAWLADRHDLAAPVPRAPADTLQASRDRLTSRWFALKGVFAGNAQQPEPLPAPQPARAPVLALFSLAGGVGKTSLVATLGRTLSARGERVLLVDTAAYGLLPFFFGASDQRPGVLRTFTAPGNSSDAPVQLLTVDCENLGPENAPQEQFSTEISRNAHGANRILVDLATASGAITRRVLRMNPTVLVPVLPDLSSVLSVNSIDKFFQRSAGTAGPQVLPHYILNQFDPSLPLHLDVREVLREQLGDRLLPFSLRRTPAVSEALAEGMTVVDYAPNSAAAEDMGTLAGWVKSLAPPASNSFRGVRWSEK